MELCLIFWARNLAQTRCLKNMQTRKKLAWNDPKMLFFFATKNHLIKQINYIF